MRWALTQRLGLDRTMPGCPRQGVKLSTNLPGQTFWGTSRSEESLVRAMGVGNWPSGWGVEILGETRIMQVLVESVERLATLQAGRGAKTCCPLCGEGMSLV